MSQEDSFEQDGSAGLTPEIDAKARPSGGSAPDADKEGVVGHEGEDGATGSPPAVQGAAAWQSHGGDAPSRGPQAADGMAEPPGEGEPAVTGPDGEAVDPDVSDGGQSGQDSGSMS